MEKRTIEERKLLVEREYKGLSIRRQSELLNINRSSLYYKPIGEKKENLELMEKMDRLFTDDPTLGVLGMQDELDELGQRVNIKRIRRLLRKMGIEAIYPKRNLSKLGKAKYIHPYLLRNLKIERPNQVWAMDITYIPMKNGFMYLTAVIDLYSRYLVGWQISNSLEKETQTELVSELFEKYGKPEIINTDQGSQYTCEHWVSFLKENGIKISMDGKGRATDNAIVERFFRTLKQKHVYLHPAKDGLELYSGINKFINRYNSKRRHQGIGRIKPIELYPQAA
jgi:putative transposase